MVDIDVDGVEQSRIRFGFISLPQNVEKTDFMVADWTAEDFASAEAAAREAVRPLREARFEFDKDVTKVTQFARDPLESLLAVGWQSTGEHEEAVSQSAKGVSER